MKQNNKNLIIFEISTINRPQSDLSAINFLEGSHFKQSGPKNLSAPWGFLTSFMFIFYNVENVFNKK